MTSFPSGHFYALVSSVTVKCADPQAAGPNITSYVYGSNVTTDTPGIAYSNQSTLINAANPVRVVSPGIRVAIVIVLGLAVASQMI